MNLDPSKLKFLSGVLRNDKQGQISYMTLLKNALKQLKTDYTVGTYTAQDTNILNYAPAFDKALSTGVLSPDNLGKYFYIFGSSNNVMTVKIEDYPDWAITPSNVAGLSMTFFPMGVAYFNDKFLYITGQENYIRTVDTNFATWGEIISPFSTKGLDPMKVFPIYSPGNYEYSYFDFIDKKWVFTYQNATSYSYTEDGVNFGSKFYTSKTSPSETTYNTFAPCINKSVYSFYSSGYRYWTTDHVTYTTVTGVPINISSLPYATKNNSLLLHSTNTIYHSTDGGKTYTGYALPASYPGSPTYPKAIECNPDGTKWVYITGQSIYSAESIAGPWTLRTNPFGAANLTNGVPITWAKDRFWIGRFNTSSSNSNYTQSKAYSFDGESWVVQNVGPNVYSMRLGWMPSVSKFYCYTNLGIETSPDGDNWTQEYTFPETVIATVTNNASMNSGMSVAEEDYGLLLYSGASGGQGYFYKNGVVTRIAVATVSSQLLSPEIGRAPWAGTSNNILVNGRGFIKVRS